MIAHAPRGLAVVLSALFLLLAGAARAEPERRVALVIGNGAYQQVPALRNPPNDARRMAAMLRNAGFEVIEGIDLDRRTMEEKLREFGDRLDGGDLGLFYYAGHGLQVGGENYLLPVDTRIQRERDLSFEAVPIGQVLRSMEGAARTNLVFLDACRDNPLVRSLARSMGTRSGAVSSGLAQVQSGVGTLISYATAPNSVARDGEGANSPFTAALLQHLATPGLDVGVAMRRVREAVITATRQQQVPWDHSSLTGEVVLVPASVAAPTAPPALPAPQAAPTDRETVFWQSAVSGGTRGDFEAYLQAFPTGVYAPLARARLASLATPAPAVPPSPPVPAAPAVTAVTASFPRPPAPQPRTLAAPGRAGWIVDGTNGCWIWNARPGPGESVRWSGSCPRGPSSGSGTLEWFREGRVESVSRYAGTLQDGRPHGRGNYTFSNGDRYEGEYREGRAHGTGEFVDASGARSHGVWRDGCLRQGDRTIGVGRLTSECLAAAGK
ncbi:caspase family protein [Muricoccus radiodurans]|uniref:caspase family protein n=1 Tax=Muricoccus radiodurans TaxID=2231721 RepID=UPI003CEF0564